ncbi:MAG: hypothetical protein ACOYJL_07805 [Tractidigestivibacter sp.]|uniref:hypothetical protein n=1 Tax=Tractidigestivibacter sp. TaxID=2847320 RepID=UPI003D9417CF
MSPEAKKLKISSLVTMIVGLVAIVCGIVFLVQGADLSDACVLVAGVVTTIIGGKGARVANVPSTSNKLVAPAGGATAANAVCLAGDVAFGAGQIAPVVVGAVVCVLTLVVTLFARTIKRKLERA